MSMKKDMTNDMTVGKPAKLILQFMLPLFLGNMFQQLYNVADSVIAGQFIGVNALAAIGSTSSLIFLVMGWLNGLSSGFAILVSQWFGAKDYKAMRKYMAMGIYLMLAFIVVMTIGLEIANEPILRMMNSPENLLGDIKGYMAVIYAGMIATGAYNALAAILRAVGDSKTPLYFLIISSVINVILDIVFIICFGMGVIGCGYATVIAQGISAVLCLIYIKKRFPILHLTKEDFRISFSCMKKLLALGVPMALQFSITAIGTIIVQGAVNLYGANYMAGFSAGAKIQNIVAVVYVSYGAAMATYVGQNCGAGRMDRVRQGVRSTQIMVILWSVVLMAFVGFGGKYMVYMFVSPSETEVVHAAVTYFRAVVWCYPFLGSIFIYRNALQGMGYGFVPMMGGVFELAARAAIVAVVAGRAGFFEVCLSDPAAWIAALIPLVPYYIWVMRKEKKKEARKAA